MLDIEKENGLATRNQLNATISILKGIKGDTELTADQIKVINKKQVFIKG